MPDTTTDPESPQTQPTSGSAAGTSSATQDNWEQRYTGLQKVVAKRDTDLHTASAELDRLKAEHEAALNELSAYRQMDADKREEQLAQQQYQELRARFEAKPPKPMSLRTGERKDWTHTAPKEKVTRSPGFPI